MLNFKLPKSSKTKIRKRTSPASIAPRKNFHLIENFGKIKLRKRWLREDLNRVFEAYQITQRLNEFDLWILGIKRKPKRGQMILREIVYRKEIENDFCKK